MMKVGIDARAAKWYRGTGIGTYTFQLLKCINKVDNSNSYLLFMPENYGLDINFESNFSIKKITENKKDNFWDEVNIPNLLKGEDIEIYHVPQNGVGLPKDKKCPFLITLHDVIPIKMPETVGERYLKIFNEEMPEIVSRCDGIITVSEYSKNDIAETFNFPKDKIFVTLLAAEDIYKPLPRKTCKKIIQKKYSIDEDFILYIGGFSPRKNIVGLIEAYSMLSEDLKKRYKLVIAGKQGISYAIYKARTEALKVQDRVIFPGFISMEDIPLLYNAASLFAYPSFYEGFGLPPIEAMACGIPVVTSNVTSIPEICENSAIFVNPFSSDEIKESLIRGLTDESSRNILRIKGLKKSAELSWLNTAKKTIAAYKQIIEISK